jgi:hypothetical protein
MLRSIGRGSLFGFLFVLLLLDLMLVPRLRDVSMLLLEPGQIPARAYWNATDDPLQMATGVLLDMLFYSALFSLAIWIWRTTRKRRAAAKPT